MLDSYEKLFSKIAMNNARNVTVINVGLGSSNEVATFYVNKSDPAKSSFIINDDDREAFSQIQLEMDTLDSQYIFIALDKPDLIIIDVEGYEYEVIQGTLNLIECYKPKLYININGYRSEEIIEFLLSKNYTLYHVEGSVSVNSENMKDIISGHLYCKQG